MRFALNPRDKLRHAIVDLLDVELSALTDDPIVVEDLQTADRVLDLIERHWVDLHVSHGDAFRYLLRGELIPSLAEEAM